MCRRKRNNTRDKRSAHLSCSDCSAVSSIPGDGAAGHISCEKDSWMWRCLLMCGPWLTMRRNKLSLTTLTIARPCQTLEEPTSRSKKLSNGAVPTCTPVAHLMRRFHVMQLEHAPRIRDNNERLHWAARSQCDCWQHDVHSRWMAEDWPEHGRGLSQALGCPCLRPWRLCRMLRRLSARPQAWLLSVAVRAPLPRLTLSRRATRQSRREPYTWQHAQTSDPQDRVSYSVSDQRGNLVDEPGTARAKPLSTRRLWDRCLFPPRCIARPRVLVPFH